MSRSIGYDPVRLDVLRRRTEEAVESLRRVRCGDPAAADGAAAVARAIDTLTELWLPLLVRIAASTAMVGGEARGPHGGRLGDPHRRRWETFALPDERLLANLREMDEDEFLQFLVAQSRRWQPVAGTGPDLDDEHVESALAAIGLALDERIAAQPGVVHDLARQAERAPVLALALRYAARRGGLITQVAGSMLAADPSLAGFHPHTYMPGLEALLEEIAADPTACLELLGRTDALGGLAGRTDLDTDLVRRVTRRGLLEAVHDDASRLADGYDVLRQLVVLANGTRDSGFAPGLARGVGDAIVDYADTLAPAISYLGEQVIVPEAGEGFVLGTYDDFLDLLGAVALDPVAQAGLGVAVGAQLDAAFVRIETDLASGPATAVRLTPATRLTRAIDEAIVAEDAEARAATAAEAARQRQLGAHVGFVAGALGLATRGSAAAVVSIIDEASGLLTSGDQPDPPRIVDQGLAGTFVREASFGLLSLLVRDPRSRHGRRLDHVSDRTWERLAMRVADVEAAPRGERETAIVALDREVRERVPALDAAVAVELDIAGIDELRRGRGTGDAPAAD